MDKKLKSVINEIKEKTKKDCYIMKAVSKPASLTDSKIGGNPYLPEGEEMPKSQKGEYMPLFCQINFEDIKLENYPDKGILQLFADKDVDWPTEFKIKYYEDISKPSQTSFPEIDLKYFFVQKEVKLSFKKGESFINVNDFRFNDLFCEAVKNHYDIDISYWMDLEDEVDVDLDDVFDAFVADSGNVGGYADFTQSDPRDNELDEDYTECLLKIDSNLNSSIEIGDSGIAWVLMREEDLINKNFENAAFDWDCC